MNGVKARSAVTAVVLTALTVLAAGCSGAGDEKSPAAGKTLDTVRPSTTPDKDRKKGAENAEKPVDPADLPGPKVPRSELTPATGSFTKKQKEYLVERVPRGMEPAAVLESGKAACEKIAYLADIGRKAATSALASGEIRNAGPAVEHLCPKYKPLLEAAGTQQ